MNVDVQRVEAIFAAALEKATPAERAAYLDQACAADAGLRSRVERLLHAHEQAGSFLAEPAAPVGDSAVLDTPTQALTGTAFSPPGSSASVQLRDSALSDAATIGQTHAEAAATTGDDHHYLTPGHKPGSLGRLAHYEVLEVLGQGGFGTVFKALDEKLHRVVAIKVLAPELAASGTARQRFTREAKSAAAVVHEHVVTIHAVEDDARPPYFVMQLVDGHSLQDKLDRQGPLGLKEILRIGYQIASGLAAAHKQGLIHRDIKPANILLENGVERVKITDFGLAKLYDDASITQSGVVSGTPMYMSPEQAEGLQVDQRSDLFSLGTVLYVMCTGRPPFRASGTMAVLRRVIEDTPRPIREVNGEIPEWLCDIIAKLHAKKPEDRYQAAQEVADLLTQYLSELQLHGRVLSAPAPASARHECSDPAGSSDRRSPSPASNSGDLVSEVSAGSGDLRRAVSEPSEEGSFRRDVLGGAGLGLAFFAIFFGFFTGMFALTSWLFAWDVQMALRVGTPSIGAAALMAWGLSAWARHAGRVRWAKGLTQTAGLLALLSIVLGLSWVRTALRPAAETTGALHITDLDQPVDFCIECKSDGIVFDTRWISNDFDGWSWAIASEKRKQYAYTKNRDYTTFTLPAGEYTLLAVRDSRWYHREPFVVTVGAPASIRLPSPPFPEPGFIALFNGKDFTGWNAASKPNNAWSIEHGRMINRVKSNDAIWNPAFAQHQTDADHLHLRLQARINPEGKASVAFGSYGIRLEGNGAACLWHAADKQRTDLQWTPKAYFQPNAWFLLETLTRGRQIMVKINGKPVIDWQASEELANDALIRLGGGFADTEFMVRNIEIKDLAKRSAGWVPLFNGKDLAGWRPHPDLPGEWHVHDGAIVGTGPAAGYLMSDRGDYRDFHLRTELQISSGADSGIGFRSSKELLLKRFPAGYESNASPSDLVLCKTVPGQELAIPLADLPGGAVRAEQWTTYEVMARGNRIVVKIDGKVVADVNDREGPTQGHLSLQFYAPGETVRFRKIEIKELPPPDPGIAGIWDSTWGPVTLQHRPITDDSIVPVGGSWIQSEGQKGLLTANSQYDPVKREFELHGVEPWHSLVCTAVLKLSPDGNKLEGPWTNSLGESGVWTMRRRGDPSKPRAPSAVAPVQPPAASAPELKPSRPQEDSR